MNGKMHIYRRIRSRSRDQFRRWWRVVVLLALSSVITSCAPQKRVSIPSYREEPQEQLPLPPGHTGTLLASANKAMEAGQPDKAEMYLERALRLSPRDAQLWHGMARVRFAQDNYAQTVQFCLKSNSLAGRNGAVVHQNWLLMEKAYLKTGEEEKAAQARQKAYERW
jgi:tetratricopeptide (TPR) repeat protein